MGERLFNTRPLKPPDDSPFASSIAPPSTLMTGVLLGLGDGERDSAEARRGKTISRSCWPAVLANTFREGTSSLFDLCTAGVEGHEEMCNSTAGVSLARGCGDGERLLTVDMGEDGGVLGSDPCGGVGALVGNGW